jgi:5-methylcytosine-specific restriction protein A
MAIQPRDEVAALLYERRFTRWLNLSMDVKPVKGSCAWCGVPMNRKAKYCGQACSMEANVRASASWVKLLIVRRDHGVCAVCGIDTQAIRYESMLCAKKLDWRNEEHRLQWGPYYGRGSSLWDADHIVPVSEGGGVCGMENYRTLCLRCHRIETALLAGRLADRRKGQGVLDLGGV